MYLFILGCAGSSFLRASFLCLWLAGATPSCDAQTSHCSGFSCGRTQAVGTWASAAAAQGLSDCDSQVPEQQVRCVGLRCSAAYGNFPDQVSNLIGRQSLNHKTTREAPCNFHFLPILLSACHF